MGSVAAIGIFHFGALTSGNPLRDAVNEAVVDAKQLSYSIGRAVIDATPFLARFDQPAVLQAGKVTAGVTWRQLRCKGHLTCGALTITQCI
jgi:hypothetical protein